MTDFFTRVARKAMGTAPAIQPLVVSRYAPSRLPNTEAELLGTEPRLQNTRPNVHKTRENSSPTQSDAQSREVDGVGDDSKATAPADNSFQQPVIEGDVRGVTPSVRVLPPKASTTHAELSENEMQPGATMPVADNEEFTLAGPTTTASQTGFDLPSTSRPPISSFEAERSRAAEPSKTLLETNVESMKDRPALSNSDDERPRWVGTDLEEEPRFQDDAVVTLIPEREPGRLTRAPSNQANQPTNHDGSLPVSFTSNAAESSFDLLDQQVERDSPVIRVTIGRIEVRAVTPPVEPAFQPSAPATPKISLDEFLREHNGRRQ